MPLLGALGTRPDGAGVEINKPGRWSRTNGIGPDPQLGFRKFRYVAAAANVVGERTRRLENKRAFGRIYVVDAPSGARRMWRRAGHADEAASRFPTSLCPTSLCPTSLGPSSLGRRRARRRAAGDRRPIGCAD